MACWALTDRAVSVLRVRVSGSPCTHSVAPESEGSKPSIVLLHEEKARVPDACWARGLRGRVGAVMMMTLLGMANEQYLALTTPLAMLHAWCSPSVSAILLDHD